MVDLQTTIMIVEGVVLLGLFRLKNAISRYEILYIKLRG